MTRMVILRLENWRARSRVIGGAWRSILNFLTAGTPTELRPNDQIGWTSLSLFYNRNGDIKEAEAAGTKAKILGWGGKIAKEG